MRNAVPSRKQRNPPGVRLKGGWRRCRLLTARCGAARRRRLAIHPLNLTRDPLQLFNRLLVPRPSFHLKAQNGFNKDHTTREDDGKAPL
jgi:hypothetical protein